MPRKAPEETKTRTKARKQKVLEDNAKAIKFQEYLMENNIAVFGTESVDDAYQTVVFRTRLDIRGQVLPMAVIVDTSVLTIIRTQVVSGFAPIDNGRLEKYLNTLNAKYKLFKYYLQNDNAVYVDVCLYFDTDDNFSGQAVQKMIGTLIGHLEGIYVEMMQHVWAKES